MYSSTASWSALGSVSFQPGMDVRGVPCAMVRSSSLSVLAEVAAEMRFPGRGDKNGALGPSPFPVVPWQSIQCSRYKVWPRCRPSEGWASTTPVPPQTSKAMSGRQWAQARRTHQADGIHVRDERVRESAPDGFCRAVMGFGCITMGHTVAAAFKIWRRSAARSCSERDGEGRCWQSRTV